MPLVGEGGRSVALAKRAWGDDMAGVRLRSVASRRLVADAACSTTGNAFAWPSSSAMRALRSGLLLVDVRIVENPLPDAVYDAYDGVSETTLSAGGGLVAVFVAEGSSRCIPGRPRRPDAKLFSVAFSSVFFLKAAFPKPRSAVCRNQDGSLAPNEAAI